MANIEKKLVEGRACLGEAEKCLKTSLLKWKPDYEGAAMEYGKAAVAFKNGKALDQAIASYLKQAEMLEKTGSDYHSAKALEAAAILYKENNEFNKAADLIEKAANMFLEHGTPSSAAVMLDKAGKMLEHNVPERAVTLFTKACDVSEAEDRIKECAEMIGKAARVLIRLKRYSDAAEALRKEIEFYNKAGSSDMLSKLVFGLVLTQLHMGDYVAADKAFQSCLRYPEFPQSEEAGAIQRLLHAYDEGDQEKADQIAKSPLFRFMENDFTKLARDLKVPGGLKVSSNKSNDLTSGADSLNDNQDDDDEFAGGLL